MHTHIYILPLKVPIFLMSLLTQNLCDFFVLILFFPTQDTCIKPSFYQYIYLYMGFF